MAQELAKTSTTDQDQQQDPVKTPDKGPGVQALEAMIAQGKPKPEQVVDLIDAHRGEHDAMFAVLHKTLGNAYVQEVVAAMDHLRGSVKRKEIVSGDPDQPNDGYFIASQQKKGAEWSTAGGGFKGTVNNKGLDTTVKVGEQDSLHGKVNSKKEGSLAWEHGGKTEGELYGSVKSGSEYTAGVSRPWDLDSGSLTTKAQHKVTPNGTTDSVLADYHSKDGKWSANGELGVQDGSPIGSLSATDKITPKDTLTGSVSHSPTSTTVKVGDTHKLDSGATVSGTGTITQSDKGTSGSLAGSYKNKDLTANGNIKYNQGDWALHGDATKKLSADTTLSGKFDQTLPAQGNPQSTFGISESTRNGNVVHGLGVDAGLGDRDYLGVKGNVDAKLGNNVYGGAFGQFQVENGKQTSAQVGASLTLDTSEKTALTLAGVINEHGAVETRLQFDVFKSRLDGVQGLADHKKDALVSAYLSYSQGTGAGNMLDDRYGASQFGTGRDAGEGRVMAGIRIKF